MPRSLPIAALLCTLLCAGGCNSSRALSRQDYQDTRDPFMKGSSLADSSDSSAAGVASLSAAGNGDTSTPATAHAGTTPPLPGPKPIQQASGIQGPRTAGTGIAHATYPDPGSGGELTSALPANPAATPDPAGSGRSWQGPALSNFLSGRDVPPSETISGESVRNRTAASTGIGRTPATAGTGRPSPAAEAAALSEMNREIGGFSSFLEQSADQGAAAVSEAGRAAEAAAANAGESAGNFADFATRKRAEWAARTRTAQADAKQTANAAGAAAAASVENAGKAARAASDDFFEQLAAPATTPAAAAVANTANPGTNPLAAESPEFDSESPESSAPSSTETLDEGFSGQPGAIPEGFEP